MKVCVIGGMGYLGRVLVSDLADQGYDITILDNFLYTPDGEEKALQEKGVNVIKGDLRNKDDLEKSMKDANALVHLAAIVGPQQCDLIPETALDINFTYVPRIATLCKTR